MSARHLFPGLVLAFALAVAPLSAGAAEDKGPAPVGSYLSWSMPLFKNWSVAPYSAARMAAHGGIAYIGTRDGRLYAVDAGSGGIRWVRNLGARISGGPAVGKNGKRLYLGTDKGKVLALKAKNGETIWETGVSSEVMTVPRIAAGMVFVRTTDDFVWALRSADGGTRWSYNVEGRSLALRGGSRPAYHKGKVFTGFSTGELVALDSGNGSPRWRQTIATPSGRTELERLVDVDAAPHVVDGTVYAAAYHGAVVALEASTGQELWRRKFSVHNDPVVTDKRIFITTSQSKVVALERGNGGTLWTQKTLMDAGSLSDPVLTKRGLVVGDGQGRVTWFDPDSGKVLGQQDVGLSAVHSPPLPVGKHALLVLTDEGTLNRVGVR